MVVILLAFTVAFFAVRAVALWAGIGRNASIVVSAAVCLSFAGGSLLHPFGAVESSDVSAGQPVAASMPGGSAAPAVLDSDPPLRSLFSGNVATLTPNKANAPGSIDDVRISPDKRFAFVRGWVADPMTKGSAHGAILIVDGRLRFNATPYYGVNRPDVARALDSPDAAHAGYEGAVMALAGLAPGSHVVQSAAITNDGHYDLVAKEHPFTL